MENLNNAIKSLRETLEFATEENIAEYSDTQIVEHANNTITNLEVENSLQNLALENSMSVADYQKWVVLAIDKLTSLKEGEEVSDEDLLGLLTQTNN